MPAFTPTIKASLPLVWLSPWNFTACHLCVKEQAARRQRTRMKNKWETADGSSQTCSDSPHGAAGAEPAPHPRWHHAAGGITSPQHASPYLHYRCESSEAQPGNVRIYGSITHGAARMKLPAVEVQLTSELGNPAKNRLEVWFTFGNARKSRWSISREDRGCKLDPQWQENANLVVVHVCYSAGQSDQRWSWRVWMQALAIIE